MRSSRRGRQTKAQRAGERTFTPLPRFLCVIPPTMTSRRGRGQGEGAACRSARPSAQERVARGDDREKIRRRDDHVGVLAVK